MAGTGKARKPVLQSETKQAAREAETKVIEADGELRGPELPQGDWHPNTVAWYDHWRRSPQAQVFISTDWDFLAETALLHTRLWYGETTMASELRLRVAKLGATAEDRTRLHISVEFADQKQTKGKPMASERRKRLLSVVGDA
jgi:hypothetical protein